MSKENFDSTHENILKWIKNLKFKKKYFGGIDEVDVLKKIEELNSLYETALLNERARYEALLQEYKGGDSSNEI